MTYRTEIHVAPDRYVCLQLPDFVPSGKAVVTVSFVEAEEDDARPFDEPDDDRQDIEWWDDPDE